MGARLAHVERGGGISHCRPVALSQYNSEGGALRPLVSGRNSTDAAAWREDQCKPRMIRWPGVIHGENRAAVNG